MIVTPQQAVRVAGLSKCYRLPHASPRVRYRRLSEDVQSIITNTFSLLRASQISRRHRAKGSTTEEFWALKDVDFGITDGEVVGVIGRNGAGKSTLLKLLSRITSPTHGRIELHGRVASLLEVGTGFHPELTGRENVYLNGAILGMTNAEITRKFDEIVDFAEVKDFLDLPVKRYSSGMYVRLAFAVAAHLEPEILIVDEVLAVGDASFQKKCLGKMGDVSKSGRTIFFVSHNMAAIQRLCNRCLFLEGGNLAFDGDVGTACARYAESGQLRTGRFENDRIRMHVCDDLGRSASHLSWISNDPLRVNIQLSQLAARAPLAVDLAFYTDAGVRVFSLQSDRYASWGGWQMTDDARIVFEIAHVPLACTFLTMDIGIREVGDRHYLALWRDACRIVIDLADTEDPSRASSILIPNCTTTITSG